MVWGVVHMCSLLSVVDSRLNSEIGGWDAITYSTFLTAPKS